MEPMEWIVLNYTLPKEPSRVRVSIWRKLKKSGAVIIGQSMWILPLKEEHIGLFNDLSGDILLNGGEAYILRSSFLNQKNTDEIIDEFNKARDDEYREVLEKCADFFDEIDKETRKENYTFAEIEENEYECNKLMNWFKDIEVRDFFQAPLKANADLELNKCRQLLDEFSKKTFEINIK